MYKNIVRAAQQAGAQGVAGRVAAVAFLAAASVGLGLLRTAVSRAPQLAWSSGQACGLSPTSIAPRARSLLAESGLLTGSSPIASTSAPLAWQVGPTEVALVPASAVCDTVLRLAVPIADRWPDDVPDDAMTTLTLMRWYDTGSGHIVPGDASTGVRLVVTLPLRELAPSSLAWHKQEVEQNARAWRDAWFSDAMAALRGVRSPPQRLTFRPGADPASRLGEVEDFLKKHGQALPDR